MIYYPDLIQPMRFIYKFRGEYLDPDELHIHILGGIESMLFS